MDKILIVDDLTMNCEMLRDILQDEYEVEMAEGGMCALEILKERRGEFAAVLLDLVMPEMDGFTMLEVMKKQRWLDKLPVIVITGEKSEDAERRSMMLGATDYFRKPFDRFLLKLRVRNAVNSFAYSRMLEKEVEEQTETLQKQYLLLKKQTKNLMETNARIMETLETILECCNPER